MESSGSENRAPQRDSRPDSDFRDLLRERSQRNRPNENLIKFNEKEYKESIKSFTKKNEENLLNILKFEDKKNYESNIIDHRLDRYVRDLFRESRTDGQFNQDLNRIIRQPVLIPRQLLPEAGRSGFFFHGFSATSLQAIGLPLMGGELKVDGERISIDKRFTRIDFMPEGRTRREASKITNSMTNAIKGLTGLVAAIDSREFDLEPVFVGTTNINMALISQRLGFKIVDSCRNPDGTIDRSKTRFTVVGRLEDIRQKLVEFVQSGLDQRVLQRDARQKRTLQPAR